ncbi:lachesin-like [Cimex lectularius]|uniref:Ig-like domain-containing protein n=1 Tax=Cimex lectularius TaxID=79782 RepID=A0A8I6S0M8_CIMLE|nr:lachesin-like [Cimex lectularius]
MRMVWYHLSSLFLLTTYSYSQDVPEEDWNPQFGEPISNVTVPLGREAVLSCAVKNLGHFKVGWLRAEDQTVLSLDTRVVTHNFRVSVSHEPDSETWRLHIRQVKYSDRGCYMCQINTNTMKKQLGCLDVHVPPDIIDSETSSDTVVEEGENVTLICKARGHPAPRIIWRREDTKTFTVYNNTSGFATVDSYHGEMMKFVKVDYTQMGAYLCIATNDIPPAVSKRIVLRINFTPVARQPSQKVGAVLGSSVSISCDFHAFPNDNTSWHREIGEVHDYGGEYKIGVTRSSYEITLHLTIRNIRAIDLGKYFCVLSNNMGSARGTIQLYEIRVETTTMPTTTTPITTTKATTSTTTPTKKSIIFIAPTHSDLPENNEIEELPLFNDANNKRGAEASSRRRSFTVSSCSGLRISPILLTLFLIR